MSIKSSWFKCCSSLLRPYQFFIYLFTFYINYWEEYWKVQIQFFFLFLISVWLDFLYLFWNSLVRYVHICYVLMNQLFLCLKMFFVMKPTLYHIIEISTFVWHICLLLLIYLRIYIYSELLLYPISWILLFTWNFRPFTFNIINIVGFKSNFL